MRRCDIVICGINALQTNRNRENQTNRAAGTLEILDREASTSNDFTQRLVTRRYGFSINRQGRVNEFVPSLYHRQEVTTANFSVNSPGVWQHGANQGHEGDGRTPGKVGPP